MKQKIRTIAEIRSGYQFRDRVLPAEDANVSVIQIKDIDDRLNVGLGNLIAVRLESPEPHFVVNGDVLFLSRGHRLFAAVVPEPAGATIATGYFFVLRPDERRVRPAFLAWSLNQPDFQEALRPFTRGTHMPLVSKTDFQDLTIALPPLAVQDRILKFQNLVDCEQQLSAAILSKRGELAQAVARQLLTGRNLTKDSAHGE